MEKRREIVNGKIKNLVKWFLYISTGVLIVVAANMKIAGEDMIPADTLWQILLSALLTSLVTAVLYPGDDIYGGRPLFLKAGGNGKAVIFIRIFLHYAALCAVMLVCGQQFGWIRLNGAGVVLMLVSVAAVYLFAFLAYYIIDMKQADEINRRLKEKYGEEE